MTQPAPILISTVQFHEALTARTMTSLDVLDAASRLGALGVEFRDSYWQDSPPEIASVRQVANERGLVVTYATTATLFATDADHLARVRGDIDAAVALGSPFLRVFQGDAPTSQRTLAWERARLLVDYAAAKGIRLALENFGKEPGCRLAEIKAVLDEIPAPALGSNVDIGNYVRNGEDPLAAIAALGPRILASHLTDRRGEETVWLGAGSLPLADIFAAFSALPQPVLHCLEFEGGNDPEGRITASLRVAQRLLTGAN